MQAVKFVTSSESTAYKKINNQSKNKVAVDLYRDVIRKSISTPLIPLMNCRLRTSIQPTVKVLVSRYAPTISITEGHSM